MQVFVKMSQPLGWQAVEVDPYDTLQAVREKLTVKVGLPLPWDKMKVKKFVQGFLKDGVPLVEQGLFHGSQLELAPILGGGGGDGGSTGAESRDCYLEMYKTKKPAKVDENEENFARWSSCQLTGEPLDPPCVCDELGSLFNKEPIVKGLIQKSLPPHLEHVTSLKHLVDLKLTKNASSTRKSTQPETGASYRDSKEALFQCPVTGLGMNGKFGFSAFRKTGHVVSQKGLKEFPQVVEELVGSKWEDDDVIMINPKQEEVEILKDRMMKRRATKGKKSKKRDQRAVNEQAAQENAPPQKKPRATEFAPAMASMDVYASIFNSSRKMVTEGETYLCRSTAARGHSMS